MYKALEKRSITGKQVPTKNKIKVARDVQDINWRKSVDKIPPIRQELETYALQYNYPGYADAEARLKEVEKESEFYRKKTMALDSAIYWDDSLSQVYKR